MKKKLLILIVFLILIGFGIFVFKNRPEPEPIITPIPYTSPITNMENVSLRGVFFAPWNNADASPKIIDKTLLTIKEQTNANSIAIIVQWFQDDLNSTEIAPRNRQDVQVNTISDARLAYLVQSAHKQGMTVLLYPIVGVATFWDQYPHPVEQAWTNIVPTPAWWDSYRKFILYYADFSQKYGVDLLTVHSELPQTNNYTDEWKNIISEVRQIYKGQLGAAVLIHDAQGSYPWMADLDFIGTGYAHGFNTGNIDMAMPEMMDQISGEAFELKTMNYVRRLWDLYQKPIVFTEVMNPSYDGATAGGFAPTRLEEGGVTPDLQEHADWYEAFLLSYYQLPWIVGAYMGDWMVGDEDQCKHGKDWAVSLGVAHKPAAKVIKHWFSQPDHLTAQPLPLKPDGHVEVGETNPEVLIEQFKRQCR